MYRNTPYQPQPMGQPMEQQSGGPISQMYGKCMASFQSMAQEAQSMSAMVSFGEKMHKVFGNEMLPGGAASAN
eukprot:11427879-Karenia_brevis.AAC.1